MVWQTPQPLLQFALERNKHKNHVDLYSLQYVFVLLQVRHEITSMGH